jgi:broad specificity phosphatase PhoE
MTTIPFDIKDPYWAKIHPGMMSRIKHRLILVRHGESESNVELTTTGLTTEFNIDHKLTDIGKEQSHDVATFLHKKGIDSIDRIEISPLYRAVQTALPCLKDCFGTDQIVNFGLREKYSKTAYACDIPLRDNVFVRHINFDSETMHSGRWWIREPDIDFEKRVNTLMDSWKTIGTVDERKQTLVFTHSQLISQLLSTDKSFHLANGSISVIDIDENNHLNVHMANYTAHLRIPTGMHTCIF